MIIVDDVLEAMRPDDLMVQVGGPGLCCLASGMGTTCQCYYYFKFGVCQLLAVHFVQRTVFVNHMDYNHWPDQVHFAVIH